MSESNEREILTTVVGDDPSPEFVDRLRSLVNEAIDRNEHRTKPGGPTIVAIEPVPPTRPKSPLIVSAAAAAVALVVIGGLFVIRSADDQVDPPAATSETDSATPIETAPTTTTTTTTSTTTTTAPPSPVVDPPDALIDVLDAARTGDTAAAMANIADDAVLDGGPLGWPGYELPLGSFQAGLEQLHQLDGSITIRSCTSEEPSHTICDVELDHAGYQALGGPATAELETEVVDGLITYWKLSNDSRYNEMRSIVVAAETEIADAVAAAPCTDWRFNAPGCAEMILRHLDALRAGADE